VDAQGRRGGTTTDTWRLTTLDIEQADSELETETGGGTSTTGELGHDSSAGGADGSGRTKLTQALTVGLETETGGLGLEGTDA